MDRFEEEQMKKTRPIEDTWYDWLIDYIPKPIRRSASVLKDKFTSFFKTSRPVQGRKLFRVEERYSANQQNNILKRFLSEENKQKTKHRKIRDIQKLFEGEEEIEERKESEKNKKTK